jgi:hypothetical protein
MVQSSNIRLLSLMMNVLCPLPRLSVTVHFIQSSSSVCLKMTLSD